ncbi:hypothetical protein E4T49_06933 [Aureobasidium sp. EXF-10728]|nr:hypothetical protein E4T49_06933 [Aureobasidium sp. EXF-10728]
MVAELKKLASSAAGKHAAYKKYTVQPTGIWKRIGDFFAVDPKRSSGIPLNPQYRLPSPGAVDPKLYDDPTTVPAADLAENPYWKRDVRRQYPKLSVVKQPDVVGLLTVGSAQNPKENVLQIGDAGAKQLVSLKEEGEKGLSAFFQKDNKAGLSVLGANGLPPFPTSRYPSSTPKRYEMLKEQSYSTKQNNHALKQMYAISGFTEGQYDSEIPHHFFQCPPVALDTKDGGMDALRFQFLGLVTYGIAVATKFRSLQMAHSHLKDQTDKLKLEKTEAETEIQALTERITLAEEAERRYKAKEPEIRHYLEQFALVKQELDRRNEDLSALGYPPPRFDYTFPPSRLLEDDTSNGRATTSHTGPSDRVGQTDPRTMEDHIPSVSSTTLRGGSSRTWQVSRYNMAQDTEDNLQNTENKRRKLSEYRYEPRKAQSPSKDAPVQKRPVIRPPLASSITQNISSRSTHFQRRPMPKQSNDQRPSFINRSNDSRTGPQLTDPQHEAWEPWDRTGINHNTDNRPDDPHYMSGALQSDCTNFTNPPVPVERPKQQKRKIQPVDNIDDISRTDFTTSERLPTYMSPHTDGLQSTSTIQATCS